VLDFPSDDDFNQIMTAGARQGLPQDAQFARIREQQIGVVENCSKCRGTGSFISYTGRRVGDCFHCKGAGKMTFKNPAPVRAANREKVQARADQRAERNWEDFVAQHADMAEWVAAKAPTFQFAAAMRDAVRKYGDLTVNQVAAISRCMDQDAQRAQKASQQASAARQTASLEFPNLRAAFDEVVSRGAKRAQITIGDINISLAQAGGRNPGALYVKDGGEYAGKIVGKRFLSSRDAKADLVARLQVVEADPTGAVKAQAAKTAAMLAQAQAEGRSLELPCGCCGILLTDPVSIARGIGPICAGKWGF
jgi:hypothetical protein